MIINIHHVDPEDAQRYQNVEVQLERLDKKLIEQFTNQIQVKASVDG